MPTPTLPDTPGRNSTSGLPLFQPAAATRDDSYRLLYADRHAHRTRRADVLEMLRNLGEASFQELAAQLGWSVNRVIPRIAELRKDGVVVEGSKRPCSITGHDVQTWRAKTQC